jgi:hypothetical protein
MQHLKISSLTGLNIKKEQSYLTVKIFNLHVHFLAEVQST